MRDLEKPNGKEGYTRDSLYQLAQELVRLFLVLLWRIAIWLFKKAVKSVWWCIQTIKKGWIRLDEWWHDNDTQEKVADIKAKQRAAYTLLSKWVQEVRKQAKKGIKASIKAGWKGVKTATKATIRGIAIGTKATIQGLFHLRTTFRKICILTAKGYFALYHRLRLWKRGIKLYRLKRKRSYQAFRRNGGIKGAIANTSQKVKSSISMFMEEDQEEATPEAVTEDDLIEAAIEERANEGKRSMKIGKSFISHAKSFMDDE